MLGRAVKESPPGYLVKVDVPEKVRVRVLSKWVFFFRRGNVHKEGTAVRKHPIWGPGPGQLCTGTAREVLRCGNERW